GGSIQLASIAKDSSGNISSQTVRTITLIDGTAPQGLSLSSLGQTILYKPGETGTATFIASDNMGIAAITCTASGAASGSSTYNYNPPQANVTQSFDFQVSSAAAPYASMSITCSAADAANNQAQKNLSLTVADVVPPVVTGASIAANSTNVPTNTAITVKFSETLLATTVNSGSVTLFETASAQQITGTVTLSIDRKSVIFAPQTLLVAGKAYSLSITATIADDAGNCLAAPYQLGFTPDSSTPSFVITPANNSVNVPVGSAVSATFSEKIDPATVTADKVSLTSISGAVPGSLTVATDSMSFTFKPYNSLGFNRAYTFTLKSGVKDISGNAITTDSTATFTTQSANSDLIGYWPMDGDWTDYSGNGNHGTANGGATFSSDKVVGTQAGSFDGVNDFVDFGDPINGSLDLGTSSFTLSTWVKTNTKGVYQAIFDKRDVSGKGYLLGIDNSNKVVGNINAGSNNIIATSDVTITDGNWHFITAVFDRSGYASIYVDGVKNGSPVSLSGIGDVSNSGKVIVGYRSPTSSIYSYFNGLVDDISIYKRALLPEDIIEHYNAGLTTDRTPPATPIVDPVPSSTYSNQIVLHGTKDAGSSIRVNGKQIVAHDDNTTWQTLYTLALGQNLLDVTSHDLAGNVSPSVNLVVDLLPMNQKDPSIAGLWHMDGDWKDYSGNGNHAVNSSVVTSTVSEGQTAAISCSSGTISAFTSTYATNCRPTSCGSCTIGSTSCSVTFNNSNCGDPCYGTVKQGRLEATCSSPAATFSQDAQVGSNSSSFNGIDNYLLGSTVNFPIGSAPRTLSAWIKTTDSNGDKSILHYGTPTGVSPPQNFHLVVTSGKAAVGNGYGYGLVAGTTIIADGVWHLVTGVYEGPATNLAKIYVDGVLQNSGTITTPATTNQNYFTGKFLGGGGQFNGLMDEISVYAHALSAQDVLALYNTSPKLILSSSGQTVKYMPGEAGVATVAANDSNGIAKLYCNASGAASEGTLVVSIDPPQRSVTQDITFRVSPDATSYEPYKISCVAETITGVLGSATLDLQAADVVPPGITGASIAENASNVSADSTVTISFSEAMASATLNTESVVMINNLTGLKVDGSVSLSTDMKNATFIPRFGLDGTTGYTLTVRGNVTDVAGNSLGSDFVRHFSTLAYENVSIQNQGTVSAPYTLAAGRYGSINVGNSYILLSGRVIADSVNLTGNSVLSQKATALTGFGLLDLVSTTLTIDATSKIDVSGKGFLGSTSTGRTVGNTTSGGSGARNGGSSGGSGGVY
ncbi:MAG: hypothetical protein FIA91_08560, partial [Geobacter sp.]|nr:hypothetical protein [Geobacter sp.]